MYSLFSRPRRRRAGSGWVGEPRYSTTPTAAESPVDERGAGSSGGTTKAFDAQETPQRVARIVRHAMASNPKEMAFAMFQELSDLDRIHLVLALQAAVSRDATHRRDTGWADELARRVGTGPTSHALTKSQVASALEYQRVLTKFSSYSDALPSWRQLLAVGVASGVPFIGFGIIDNGIMITAGEQIDMLFGARLGISTLASAALGNVVADVVGVGVTQQIQNNAKRLRFAAPPRLSMLQQNMRSVRVANFAGAILGVSIGCVIGMTPLAFMEPGFFAAAGEDGARRQGHGNPSGNTHVQMPQSGPGTTPAAPQHAAETQA